MAIWKLVKKTRVKLVEIVQSCSSDEPEDPTATIVSTWSVAMFPVDRLQKFVA